MALVRIGRKNSHGLKATLARINHHAPKIKQLVLYLARHVKKIDCIWSQEDTVHTLVAKNGNQYKLRGIREGGAYVAVRLSVKTTRLVRDEKVLATCYYDERNGVSWSFFADMVKHLAEHPS